MSDIRRELELWSLSDFIRHARRAVAGCSARRGARRCATRIKRRATPQCTPQRPGPPGCSQKARLLRCDAWQWNDHCPRAAPCIHRFLATTRTANKIR